MTDDLTLHKDIKYVENKTNQTSNCKDNSK